MNGRLLVIYSPQYRRGRCGGQNRYPALGLTSLLFKPLSTSNSAESKPKHKNSTAKHSSRLCDANIRSVASPKSTTVPSRAVRRPKLMPRTWAHFAAVQASKHVQLRRIATKTRAQQRKMLISVVHCQLKVWWKSKIALKVVSGGAEAKTTTSNLGSLRCSKHTQLR